MTREKNAASPRLSSRRGSHQEITSCSGLVSEASLKKPNNSAVALEMTGSWLLPVGPRLSGAFAVGLRFGVLGPLLLEGT